MRMTSKGQVTVPKRLRDLAGMPPGSDVAFDFVEGKVTLALARKGGQPSRGEKAVAALRGRGTANRDLSTDEIMRLMRGDD